MAKSDSAEEVPAFPPPPVEQGMRYTVDVDIPMENDILSVQFLHHLRQVLEQQFGENLAINLRNKQRILHAPPGLPNNGLPPAPPNNGPPPSHNPGQDPHNNNINESNYNSKEESARLKQQERATLKRKKRKQREGKSCLWKTFNISINILFMFLPVPKSVKTLGD
ncbi:hypothetical protein ACFXTI_036515 [Malus domestica]